MLLHLDVAAEDGVRREEVENLSSAWKTVGWPRLCAAVTVLNDGIYAVFKHRRGL